MNIRLSVVIPAYQAQVYLRPCVESVLASAPADSEIILINDGSTDGTDAIGRALADEDSRVCYVARENRGVSATRNQGIELARGEYIFFVDADDLLPEGAIARFLTAAEDADFVMSGFSTYRSGEILQSVACPEFAGNLPAFLTNVEPYFKSACLLGPCFKLFRREILVAYPDVRFPEHLSFGEDAIFVLRYLACVKQVRCLNFSGYLYRKENSQSLSSRFRDDKLDINMQICDLLSALLTAQSVADGQRTVKDCRAWFFDQFTGDLMSSPLSYGERKALYRKQAARYGIADCYAALQAPSAVQRLRHRAIGSDLLFWCMSALYRIK